MIDEPVPTMPDSVPAISPTVRTKRKPNGLQLQDRRDAENKTGGTPKTRPAGRRTEERRDGENRNGEATTQAADGRLLVNAQYRGKQESPRTKALILKIRGVSKLSRIQRNRATPRG